MFWACTNMGSLYSEYLMKTLKGLSQEKKMTWARGSLFYEDSFNKKKNLVTLKIEIR